jgi:hypothetical protein
MYVDSSPLITRRSGDLRGDCRQAAPARRQRPVSATAAVRRTRLTDAIVSQWLLDQLPADHRHAAGARR